MKHILLSSCLIFFLNSASEAQYIPNYSITVLDSARSTGYYFLCALKFGNSPPQYPIQMILDKYGRPVYLKHVPSGVGSDFRLLPNGLMIYNSAQKFYMEDSLFNIVDSVYCRNGVFTDGHDMRLLPNGHFLLIGYENVSMDLSSFHLFNNNGSPGSTTATVVCGVIQELDTNKNVVFEWHARNYYAIDDADEYFLNSPTNVDWMHFNAVEMDTDGNILVSVRHFNEITKVNRADSSIIWRLGGKRNQFTFTNDTAMFAGEHDIRRLSNGNITLYDNGKQSVPLHVAAGKEYTLDETAMTATLAWSYVENPNAYSRATGNVQRLPGNYSLINYGLWVGDNVVFNVVDSTGNKIFEMTFPDTLGSYRAFNYDALPWQLPRPQLSCDSSAGQYYLDAGPGYSSYLWSTGETTQTIAITSADTFNVFVPLNNGDYITSEYLVVTDPSNPCGPLSIPEIEKSSLSLYPNPVTNELHIEMETRTVEKTVRLEVIDVVGRILINELKDPVSSRFSVTVSGLSPGIYFLRINHAVKMFIKK